ncbi:RNA 3 -terminal phosphate cyclase [Hyphodiscus hymeniophilus]|uniref:RNA 3 -terminal phosphate cyclase n=1 Tax=Hyphodiscus hymeniophilus TaxID=353542 RepID=A0A9P6SMK0_9HELO|nr:RNA 3 -terminal phosphate cyclase [Hyphodiscus hymeniophilus]
MCEATGAVFPDPVPATGRLANSHHRPGKRGGGLKAQHVSCIRYLAEATEAEVVGCEVGSKSFGFNAKLSPIDLVNRNIKIKAESAASVLLVFQSILPFLLFAGDDQGSPITVTIQGGTNVSFSLSFEYLDQVLLPALEMFGIKVRRKLEYRGWSHGSIQVGSARFQIAPLSPGQTLKSPEWPKTPGTISKIDISIIVPRDLQEPLKRSLDFELDLVFPGVELNALLVEDSRHKARIYTLLVAHTTSGLRLGHDWLYDSKTKDKDANEIATEIAQKVVDGLDAEIRKGGTVDEYLQDQLIVFQALAEGISSIPGSVEALTSMKERVDQTDKPFGQGSTHTTTARWVTSQLLPQTKWIDKGRSCEGIGFKVYATETMTESRLH